MSIARSSGDWQLVFLSRGCCCFFNKAKTCSFLVFTFGWCCCIMKRLESLQDFVLLCFSRNMSRRVLGVAKLSNNSWHYFCVFQSLTLHQPLVILADEAFFSPTAADNRGRVTEMFRATARTRGQVLWEIHVPQQKQRQPLQIGGGLLECVNALKLNNCS